MSLKRPPQPLVSYLLLSGIAGEEELCKFEYKKVEGDFRGRFGLPIAKLVNLPPHLSQETFYIEINDFEEQPKTYWNEGEVSFIGLSQIKYVGLIHVIHISTFLISPASLNIGFQAPESLILQDKTSVMAQAWVKNTHGNGYTGTNLFPLPGSDLAVDSHSIEQIASSAETPNTEVPDHRFHASFNNQVVFKKDELNVTIASDLKLEDIKDIIEKHIVIE